MAISQTRLDAMINEQRTMFPNERLLVDESCLAFMNRKHNFDATLVPYPDADCTGHLSQRASNPCTFFCSSCLTTATIHRYGRPFIDSLGRLVRRCMNDGTSRRHTNNDRERCTDKHVLLKKYQVHRGIPAHLRSQMENPDAQIERERLRQERRETTNERPSEFQDMSENAVRLRNLPDGSVERITQRPGALFATREVLDPYTERLRRETPAHTRAECGGCVGYYKPNGQLVKHRPLSMAELL
jgi:hypothetical protein